MVSLLDVKYIDGELNFAARGKKVFFEINGQKYVMIVLDNMKDADTQPHVLLSLILGQCPDSETAISKLDDEFNVIDSEYTEEQTVYLPYADEVEAMDKLLQKLNA